MGFIRVSTDEVNKTINYLTNIKEVTIGSEKFVLGDGIKFAKEVVRPGGNGDTYLVGVTVFLEPEKVKKVLDDLTFISVKWEDGVVRTWDIKSLYKVKLKIFRDSEFTSSRANLHLFTDSELFVLVDGGYEYFAHLNRTDLL